MSIGSSLSGITFGGLASGIDSESMISRLIAIEAIPLQRLQVQKQQLAGRQGVLTQFKSRLTSLATSAGALNSSSAFNPITASSSKTEVATITASSGATAGTYELSVSKLAQAHKIASAAQTNTTDALNQTGSFSINGKAVKVEATDSLKSIATKINSLNVGVTASVIDGGEGNAYLTMTANKTGLGSQIQAGDITGSILANLGVVSGAAAIREPITNGATSYGFTSTTDPMANLLGVTGLGPTQITINSVAVNVDLSTQNMQQVADAINAASAGVTATVRSVDTDGKVTYKLDIVGASTPTLDDPNGTLEAIGVLQKPFGNQLLAAQNAEFELDGIDLTSETNTSTTVIPGATLTLLKANATTPETSTIILKRDDEDIKKKVKGFMDAYNNVIDFVKANSAFDKDTFASGALFGDPVARQVESEVSTLVFENVAGLTGPYTNLTQLGFEFDEVGKLTLDETKLTAALAADSEAVGALFRAKGVASTSSLAYISSTDKTIASGAGSYEVNITQPATRGSYTAATAQTTANPSNETLTFDGTLFGSGQYQLVLPVGSTLTDAVNKINSDAKLKDLVTASNEGGFLTITSKKYGTTGNFTVVSNLAAASDNSGIGIGSPGTTVAGLDVAGTINGETATGAGQFLTGDTANATTSGLQIQYTGSSTGLVGTIQFTKGVGSKVNDMVAMFTDTVSGVLTTTDQGIQAQIDTIDDSMQALQERLQRREQELRARFARMEEAMNRIQGQATRLQAIQPAA